MLRHSMCPTVASRPSLPVTIEGDSVSGRDGEPLGDQRLEGSPHAGPISLLIALVVSLLLCVVSGQSLAAAQTEAALPGALEDVCGVSSDASAIDILVLKNDLRLPGTSLAIKSFDSKTSMGGRVTKAGDGVLRYAPAANALGMDAFRYTITDGQGGTSTGTVKVFVNAPVDATAARDAILKGVRLDRVRSYSSGHISVFGPTALPVLHNGLHRVSMAAATCGKGRVVVFGDYVYVVGLGSNGAGPLWRGAVEWTSRSKRKDLSIVTNTDKLHAMLKEQGFTKAAHAADWSKALGRADVLLIQVPTEISRAEMDSITSFLVRGGAVLACPGGRSWTLKSAAPINRLFEGVGLGWSARSASSREKLVTTRATDMGNVLSLGKLRANRAAYSSKQHDEAKAALDASRDVLLFGSQAYCSVRKAIDLDSLCPSIDSPITDPLERSMVFWENTIVNAVDPNLMFVHPWAPQVEPNTPRVSKTLTVNAPKNHRGEFYVDTGLYAPPGETITVKCPPEMVGKGIMMVVNHLLPKYSIVDNLKIGLRYMPLTGPAKMEVNQEALSAVHIHGGLVIFIVPHGVSVDSAKVEFDGVVEAPHYVLGETTKQQWDKIKHRGAPWGTIVSDRVVITAHTRMLRAIPDIEKLARLWRDMMFYEADFYVSLKGLRPYRVNMEHHRRGHLRPHLAGWGQCGQVVGLGNGEHNGKAVAVSRIRP